MSYFDIRRAKEARQAAEKAINHRERQAHLIVAEWLESRARKNGFVDEAGLPIGASPGG